MATLPPLNYVSNAARTQGEVKTALEDTNTFIRTLFGSDTDTATMPIANNSVLPSKLALGAWTTVASAATVNLGAQTSRNIIISGTTGITSFGSTATPDNVPFNVRFSGSLTITHSANLICPGAANLSVVAGDLIAVVQDVTGTWRIINVQRVTNPSNLIPVGASANNIVQLDGSARLPAVDGSQLTKVTKLLASGTVSAVAQLDLVLSSYIAAGYTRFRLELSNLKPVTNSVYPILRVSNDGGATFASANYQNAANYLNSGSTVVGAAASSSVQFTLSELMGSAVGKEGEFIIEVNSSGYFTHITRGLHQYSTTVDFINSLCSGFNSLANVNALRVAFTSGNISTLNYRIYGQ